MQTTTFKYPLIKLPQQTEQTLYLIGEELKCRKLFWALQQAGIDDCYFQPHLDSLILRGLGMDSSDETYEVYSRIMERRSKKIEADRKSITKQSLKVYQELLHEKKKSEQSPAS